MAIGKNVPAAVPAFKLKLTFDNPLQVQLRPVKRDQKRDKQVYIKVDTAPVRMPIHRFFCHSLWSFFSLTLHKKKKKNKL